MDSRLLSVFSLLANTCTCTDEGPMLDTMPTGHWCSSKTDQWAHGVINGRKDFTVPQTSDRFDREWKTKILYILSSLDPLSKVHLIWCLLHLLPLLVATRYIITETRALRTELTEFLVHWRSFTEKASSIRGREPVKLLRCGPLKAVKLINCVRNSTDWKTSVNVSVCMLSARSNGTKCRRQCLWLPFLFSLFVPTSNKWKGRDSERKTACLSVSRTA